VVVHIIFAREVIRRLAPPVVVIVSQVATLDLGATRQQLPIARTVVKLEVVAVVGQVLHILLPLLEVTRCIPVRLGKNLCHVLFR